MIGTRLRKLRIARGLTQRQLGEPRYTHAYVSTIEAGRRRPSREAVEHFAAKLGVGVEELETGRAPHLEPGLRLRLHQARVEISEGRIDEADVELRRIGREAKRFGLIRLEAATHEVRGLWLQRTGRPEEALTHYQLADELLRDEPPTARVDAIQGKAICFTSLGDVRYAIFLLESVLDEIERAGLRDPDALARVHAGLVYAYIEAGLLAKAAASAAALERLAPRVDDPERIAQMHLNVARQYLASTRVDDATASLQRAEDAYRQLGLLTETGGVHLARGYVHSRRDELADARRELDAAREIFERTRNAKDLTRTLNELSRIARLEGRSGDARSLLERSIALLGTSDDPILAWAHLELGRVLTELGEAAAEKHLRTAIDLYERTEQPVGLAVAHRILGDLERAQGEASSAGETYRAGLLAVEPML
jgi:tetratricopeptide (TPR) repeat protein